MPPPGPPVTNEDLNFRRSSVNCMLAFHSIIFCTLHTFLETLVLMLFYIFCQHNLSYPFIGLEMGGRKKIEACMLKIKDSS